MNSSSVLRQLLNVLITKRGIQARCHPVFAESVRQ